MNKFTHLFRLVQYLFDDGETARKTTQIIEGLLKARAPRLSDIAREMSGNEAPFLIGDPTTMPRPRAKKTEPWN